MRRPSPDAKASDLDDLCILIVPGHVTPVVRLTWVECDSCIRAIWGESLNRPQSIVAICDPILARGNVPAALKHDWAYGRMPLNDGISHIGSS